MALPEVLPQGCGSPQIREDDLFSGELTGRMTIFSNISSLISGEVKKWTPPETPNPKDYAAFLPSKDSFSIIFGIYQLATARMDPVPFTQRPQLFLL